MRPALWSVAGELLTGPRRSVPVPGRVSVTQSESPAQAPMCPIHPFHQEGLCDQLGGPGGGSPSTALAREPQGTPRFLGRAFG